MFTFAHENIAVKVRAGKDRQFPGEPVHNVTVKIGIDRHARIIYRRRVVGSSSAVHYLAEEALTHLINPLHAPDALHAIIAALAALVDQNNVHYNSLQRDRRNSYITALTVQYNVKG